MEKYQNKKDEDEKVQISLTADSTVCNLDDPAGGIRNQTLQFYILD